MGELLLKKNLLKKCLLEEGLLKEWFLFDLNMSKVSLKEWFLFGYDKVKLLLAVNVRIIVRFYFKSTFSLRKSNSKDTSLKSTFSCLKSTFSCRKNKLNTLSYCATSFSFY